MININQIQILVDSREKGNKHILKYFDENQIGYAVSKLFVGDYCKVTDHTILIDKKADCLELFQNLGKDHKRFSAECQRAQASGIQLIILIEEELPIGGMNEYKVPRWKYSCDRHKKGDLKSKMNPVTAKKIMITLMKKYGVKFKFCKKEDSAKIILNLLKLKEDENET